MALQATASFTPFSPGFYYVFVTFSDDLMDTECPGAGGFIDLTSYLVLDVDTSSLKQSVDNDYNLECNGGRFCTSLHRVWLAVWCDEQCVSDWSECPGACPEDMPVKCPDGVCVESVKQCGCPEELPVECE